MRSIPRCRFFLRTVAAALGAAALSLTLTACDEQPTDPVADLTPPPAFATAAECGVCHPDQLREWEASMHAFSGVDPVMLVLSDMAVAELGEEQGRSCRKCHAPVERRAQLLAAAGARADFTEEGLNCDACHSISEVPPVASIDFLDDVDPTGPKYANLEDPVQTSAHGNVSLTFYSESIYCAPCHQVNLPDGNGFENSYQEWNATVLSGMGIECQDCHMPRYTGRAAVGAGVPERDDLHRHTMTGVDYAYFDFRDIDRDEQIRQIRQLLENAVTVTADALAAVADGGDLALTITVFNDRTGHSIPSGVSFAREMWVDVSVRDGNGALVYASGQLDPDDDDLVHDADLMHFWAQMKDADGNDTGFAWQAHAIDESGMLEYLASRSKTYTADLAPGTPGPLALEMALRFRPLRPSVLRDLGLEEYLPLEIFDMWTESVTVNVE